MTQLKGHPASKETFEQIIYQVAEDKPWCVRPNCGHGGETKRFSSAYCLPPTTEPQLVETAVPDHSWSEADLDTET